MSELTSALLLGVVQGLTEFLPISSSGHLVLLQHLLRFPVDPARFDILLHAATMLSIVVYYRVRLFGLLRGVLAREKGAWQYLYLLILGSLPTAFIAFLFRDPLEASFGKPQDLWYQFWITSLVLILAHRFRKKATMEQISPQEALLIGIAQGISIVPAISRSGMTAGTAILLGISPRLAAEYSFLLGLPAMLGATLLELHPGSFSGVSSPLLLAGFLAAFAAGLLGIFAFVRALIQGWFLPFAWYCLGVGLLALFLFPFWR